MKSYIFKPRRDITATEIADLQVLLSRHLNASPDGVLGGEEVREDYEALPPECKRHITIEEYEVIEKEKPC